MLAKPLVLIFDIDMTICDNTQRKRRSIERALGIRIDDNKIDTIRGTATIEVALKQLGLSGPFEVALDKTLEHMLHDIDLFEHDVPLENSLETLWEIEKNGYVFCYATARPVRETAIAFLEQYGFPKREVFSEYVIFGKGSKSRMFKEILAKFGAAPHMGVSIGDTKWDALAAKEVGMWKVGICQHSPQMCNELAEYCDYVISHITQLSGMLERISARIPETG